LQPCVDEGRPPLVQTPPAIIRQLHADEHAFAATHDARFARHRQMLIRALGRDPRLAAAVVRLAPAERDDILARRDLQRLTAKSPPLKAHIRVGAPPTRPHLLAWYRDGERRFGVRWQLLAAVNFVESAFGKVRNTSTAGAQGPMQFLPATWRAYGFDGNVRDPHDAILGAANYLAANGGAHDERRALLRYNHSTLYVDAVLHYAHRIAHVPSAFSEYYAWDVYIRTPSGERRVTVP
jgi:soluble lytic murein transglycosylase-like protein